MIDLLTEQPLFRQPSRFLTYLPYQNLGKYRTNPILYRPY